MKDTAALRAAAQKAAIYLYAIEDCPEELKQTISTLRQMINEEFVSKGKQISSQSIWSLLNDGIAKYVSKVENAARLDECIWWKDTQHFGLRNEQTDERIENLKAERERLEA